MGKYPIPAATVRVETEVSKSKFIATLSMADSVAAAREFIASIRAEMPEASHHVYAFKVGYGSSINEGVSDDGEPTGTAGPPILAVVRGSVVGDVVLVVTRYFGGIKLGTGGLVRAYGDAARAAFAAMTIREKIEMAQLGLTISYSLYERVKLIAAAHQAEITGEEFAGEITLYLTLPVDNMAAFTVAIRDLSAGKVEPIVL
ncbi:MAG: YigZ family protein [Anaerolineae bacterium]|nr:YigZ family protein [Anaerolineae bacterium]